MFRTRVTALVVATVFWAAACGSGGDQAKRSSESSTVEGASGGAGATPGATGAQSGAQASASGAASANAGSGSAPQGGKATVTVPQPPGPYKGEVGVTDKTITLAWIYPRSGPYAAIARNLEPAIRSAMNEINAAGGIHGRRLDLVTGDDGYNNASTALASAKALRDKAFGFTTFGILASTVISKYANEQSVPTIVANLDRGTGLKLKWAFTPSTYLETSAGILPGFIKNRLKKGSEEIGVFYQTTPQVGNVRRFFGQEAAKLGMKVVIEQPVEETPSTCVNEVSRVQGSGATVAVMFLGPLPAVCVLRDAATAGYRPTWTGAGTSFNLNITNTASGGLTEGIKMVAVFRTLETPEGRRYAAAVQKYYPDSDAEDDDLGLVAWGQAHLWAEGLRRAGPKLTREGFVKAMETLNSWDGGVFAPATFRPGDRYGPRLTVVTEARNRRWTTIDPTWRTRY